MSSKLNKVGYLEINHRDSPGLDEEVAHSIGLGDLPVGRGQLFQADTYTCTHCSRVVIMNPKRQRDRAYCAKCDRWICDMCGATMAASGECLPISKLFDQLQEAAARAEQLGGY